MPEVLRTTKEAVTSPTGAWSAGLVSQRPDSFHSGRPVVVAPRRTPGRRDEGPGDNGCDVGSAGGAGSEAGCEQLLAFLAAATARILSPTEEVGELGVAGPIRIGDVGLEAQSVAERLL